MKLKQLLYLFYKLSLFGIAPFLGCGLLDDNGENDPMVTTQVGGKLCVHNKVGDDLPFLGYTIIIKS